MNKTYYIKGTGIELALAVLSIIGAILVTLQPIAKQKIQSWAKSKAHSNITIVNETEQDVMMQLSDSSWFSVIKPGEKTDLPDQVEDDIKNSLFKFIGEANANQRFSCMNHFGNGDVTVQVRQYNDQLLCQFNQSAPAA